MIRWDNVWSLVLVLLIVLATQQLIVVMALHGPTLRAMYWQAFRPWQRPIVELEFIALAVAIVYRLRKKHRER